MKTLIIISGGDAPGINATMAHYCRLMRSDNHEVVVADGGLVGLIKNGCIEPDLRTLRLLEGQGGSLYATSRDPILAQSDTRERIQQIIRSNQIDNILMFGGDGSLRHVYSRIVEWGYKVIGLPTTIDNDVVGTEYTLGFDSACNFAYGSITGSIVTASALNGRVFVIETLGGDTGFLALDIACGAGAHAVLLPEYEFDVLWLGQKLKHALEHEGFALVVLSEGVKMISEFPTLIPEITGTRLRYVKLGHAQRGAVTSHKDRLLGYNMASLAYQSFLSNQWGIIVMDNDQLILQSNLINFNQAKLPDINKYKQVNGL